MKTIMLMFLFGSLSAQAGKIEKVRVECQLTDVKLVIKEILNSELVSIKKTATYSNGSNKHTVDLVEEKQMPRTTLTKNKYYLSLLHAADSNIDRILDAKIYIDRVKGDQQEGLIVFRGGHGSLLTKVWFSTITGQMEVCQ